MKESLVSVIIPVYKVEKYLNKCVDSVLNQTYKNLEIILVDDGSPDGCPKMCDEFADKDKRIKVIHKKNGGLSDARNAGIETATGKYLTFIDSDDFIINTMIEEMYSVMTKHDCDIAMCNWQQIKEGCGHESAGDGKTVLFRDNEVFELLFNKRVPLIMTAWGKLYKKDIFNEIRYPKGKIHEDEFVIHKILNLAKKVCYIDKKFYCNLYRESSITGQGFSLKRLDGVEAKKQRLEFVKNNRIDYYQQALEQYLKSIIINFCMLRKYKLSKDVEGELLKEFNSLYKELKTKSLIMKLFKFSKPLAMLCLKIKKII